MGFAWKFGFWFTSWASIIAVGHFSPRILIFAPLTHLCLLLGIVLLLYGLLLNALAGRTLKKYGHMRVRKGLRRPERLVEEGIYSCMRHPAQFGSLFFGVGLALLTMKLIAILYAGWFSMLALYFIMAVEERETLQLFGEEYCRFLRERKPFTFSLKCLLTGIKALRDKKNQDVGCDGR